MAARSTRLPLPSASKLRIHAQYVRAAVVILLSAWAVTALIHDLELLVRGYTALPFWDAWRTIQDFPGYKHLQFSVFFKQQNEHRIVFPVILFALDDLLFRGRQIFTIAVSAVVYIATWCLLARSLPWSRTGDRFAHICAILSGAIILLWPGSTLVVGSPFQVVWTLVEFAGAGALVSLALLYDSGHRRHLVLTILCAVVATFSSASGLFTWPVIVGAALLLPLRRRYLLALSISGIASIALYFTDFQFPEHSNWQVAAKHPLLFCGFVADYLGVPFSAMSDHAGIIAGAASIAAVLCFATAAWRLGLLRTRPGITLLGFYTLIFATAVMTGLGRMDPIDPSRFQGAAAHRYLVVPLEGWVALAMIAGWILPRVGGRVWAVALAVLLVALFVEDGKPGVRAYLDNPRVTFFGSCQIAALNFQSGLEDSGIIRGVLPFVEDVRRYLKIMRRNRLSVFWDGREEWIGKPALSVFASIYTHPEAGAITVEYPIESGLELIGWSDSPRRIFGPEQLVFLNEQQKIVGFGSKVREDFFWQSGQLDTPSSLVWVGFVNRTIPSRFISAYKLAGKGRILVPVGKAVSLESLDGIKSVPERSAGGALAAINWTMRGKWRKSGALLRQPQGDPPTGDTFESWARDDANTGDLVSAALQPPNGCLTIPVAHGPSVTDLSVRVIDATTSATLVSVPMFSADLSWRYWQLRVPETAHPVRIVAEDHGRGWGQWLTIGEPHSCNN